jgi:RNA polymerase sigma-70 factor (ECF subfamily)
MKEIFDNDILDYFFKGDKDKAFSLLLEKYKERLYWHIRKIVISHENADDVLQNTFLNVWRYLDKFKKESSLYTWLYRIATNESLAFLKKNKPEHSLPLSENESEFANRLSDDNLFTGDEIALKLQTAINTLPEKQKLVFNMKYFDEMKYLEMSEILETSVGALKASYHHAVKKIEEFLKQD